MARENMNISLEPEVRYALDEFARLLGINRSAATNMILKATLDVDRKELADSMTAVMKGQGREDIAEAIKIAING